MEAATIYALVSLVAGAILLFFGARFMKAAVSIIGFLMGYSVASAVIAGTDWSPFTMMLVSLAAGIALAFLAFSFYRLAITISIAYFFGSLAYSVAPTLQQTGSMPLIIGVAVGVICFVLLELFKVVDLLFAFITSAQGASSIVAGIYIIMFPAQLSLLQNYSVSLVLEASGWWLAAWFALTAVGFVYQLKTHKASDKHN